MMLSLGGNSNKRIILLHLFISFSGWVAKDSSTSTLHCSILLARILYWSARRAPLFLSAGTSARGSRSV